MQRYFVPDDQFHENHVWITGEDAKHIMRVMRMNLTDKIVCANNMGEAFLCEIDKIQDQQVAAVIRSQLISDPELPVRVVIAQGMPKGEKFDTIVRKGTECGASAFIPFYAERSVAVWQKDRIEKKRLRLGKIAKEAAEQSHRLFIPEVTEPMNLGQLLAACKSFTYAAVAYEETAKKGELSALPLLLKQMKPGDSLLAVIGPEGGLSHEEALAFQVAGCRLCGLGPRIMRTETAPLYLLSAVSYQFELLNNEVGY
ncbi:16S rRNA (uracil(1498)-N(3))-methyltransferase [Sporolactobacillus shoreae]|uniref:Ribosomal RNA small subunit methyltransferase E n=1 Tax=Sporolactobacillus shoreae TaxID=1465501 RepID=A0A4Z0GSF1_9BACL|nr:16S rRNA (uracil(1498)-N(3))-methyltransferase [Sporolactobacillus shoreae]TGA99575.1 16S rRNA (uracil(1498)-N(3))-methyltransferase [Sporolactobacillus shoreae]